MLEISIIFICAVIALFLARSAALKIGLVDKPNVRKRHRGHIPLVGGISIYLSLWALYVLHPEWLPDFSRYMMCITALLLIGMLDDRFDIPVLPRILLQALVAGIMMISGRCLVSLGNILFGNELYLGWSGYVITLLSVWGAINAFNMIDGIDGLLGVLSCVTFSALMVMFYLGGNTELAHWSLCLLAATLPYILLNLGIPWGQKCKVFMGDAGSTLIGFTVIWLLVVATQGTDAVMRPVTALWCIALPLMDMVSVMTRRICRGDSPFKPDREHVHHILLRAGLSLKQTLSVTSGVAVIFAIIGIVAERAEMAESMMLSLFLLAFVGYFWSISYVCVILAWLGRTSDPPISMHSNVEQPTSNK